MTLPAQITFGAPRQTDLQGRQHWIDWLRVAAVAGVFLFHTLRPFNTDGWHVKNGETSAALNLATTLFSSFGLAVLFLLAGMGIRFALRKRTWRTFIRERTTRLLVPFAVGTAVLSPFQGWLEATQKGLTPNPATDLFGWWSVVITWAIGRGFTPSVFGIGYHLWFLGFLFALSALALPLCALLLRSRGRAFTDGLASRLAWPASSLVFVVPIYLLMGLGALLGTEEHDWFEFAWYFAYLMVGFVVIGDTRLIDGVRRDRWPALSVALATTVLILAGFPVPLDQLESADGPTKLATGGLFALEGWAWTLVVLNVGLGLPRFQRVLADALGDAVLPFYVIHQPVILAVAFWVVAWPAGIPAKWLAVFAISLPVTLAIVELALRTPVTRWLLGTRARPPTPASFTLATPGREQAGPASTARTEHGRAR